MELFYVWAAALLILVLLDRGYGRTHLDFMRNIRAARVANKVMAALATLSFCLGGSFILMDSLVYHGLIDLPWEFEARGFDLHSLLWIVSVVIFIDSTYHYSKAPTESQTPATA